MPLDKDDFPICAKCEALMIDYDEIHESTDHEPDAIPDYAKCKSCGHVHNIEA